MSGYGMWYMYVHKRVLHTTLGIALASVGFACVSVTSIDPSPNFGR